LTSTLFRAAGTNVSSPRTPMMDFATAPYGALILRLCLGIMFIAHAMLKIRVFTLPGTIAFFASLGLPGWLAYVTIATELSGGACLILGIMPRYVALLLIPLILGTIVTVHGKKGWLFSNPDGGWEYPAFWAAALLVQFLLGDGELALVSSPPFHH
jgi:putative oxidoreductase